MFLSQEGARLFQQLNHTLRRIEAARWLASDDLFKEGAAHTQGYLDSIGRHIEVALTDLAKLAEEHHIVLREDNNE